MKSCFLFGHSDCPDSMLPKIEQAIEDYYLQHGVTAFYVGNRGRFDSLAAVAVKRIKHRYPDITLYLVLAYHPGERTVLLSDGFDGSFYPPLETVPRPYAIVRANQYMVNTTNYIICYVKHIGNTRTLLEYARNKKNPGVHIKNIAEDFS